MKEINFYRSESGKSPVEEFLDDLTAKQAKKIAEKRMKDYLKREKS